MTRDRTILITGVTGNQGGAVARALQGTGFHLRGLTRMPEGERAAALARQGVDVVKGDLDNEATLRRALSGAWGIFGVQNTLEAGVEREEARASVLRSWRAKPASNTSSTHQSDRPTSRQASRTSTTNGASRKPCAAFVSPRM
jgi:uncharacterized protein YbjT (DUF2867 family)